MHQITDYLLNRAATEMGAARHAMLKAERAVKHVEAIAFTHGEGSVEHRKMSARLTKEFQAASESYEEAAGAYEDAKTKKESALALCDVWRTQESNRKGLKV